ncbi:ribbon-helix-helix domain-containing protein [Paracoccus sp. 22332]|uniref:ribbon-helix-helix domain-containing protein n=1 Tax=Paracoccus sp. 22332 TaxID=3453913 RepID=UPI003F850D94
MTPPVKRSVTIDGHRTSVSLEDAFWRGMAEAARARGLTRAQLIGQIDHARPPEVGLATALRLFVMAELRPATAGGASPPARACRPLPH